MLDLAPVPGVSPALNPRLLSGNPPGCFAEQQRIVAKVEELLRWCDQLEAHLTTARTTATHLLDATLRQLLAA